MHRMTTAAPLPVRILAILVFIFGLLFCAGIYLYGSVIIFAEAAQGTLPASLEIMLHKRSQS